MEKVVLDRSHFVVPWVLWLAASLNLLPALASAQNLAFAGSWPVPNRPLGLAMDTNGNVLVTTTATLFPPVSRYSASGTLMSVMGGTSIHNVYSVAATPSGDMFYPLYQVSFMSHMTSTGADLGGWGRSDCCFLFVALDHAGTCPGGQPCTNVYVTDPVNHRVFHYTSLYANGYPYVGEWISIRPSGITFLGGALYVSSFDGIISKYSPTGTLLGSFATGATQAEQLASGPDGRLYLADHGTSRLLVLSTDGTLLGSIGASVPGYVHGPVKYFGVVVASDGSVFAGDYDHSRILKFVPPSTPARTITWGSVKTHYR